MEMMIQHQSYVTLHRFLIADIGEDNIILGYPFFEAANPQVNWVDGNIKEEITISTYDDWEQLAEEDKGTWFHATIAKSQWPNS